jgi:hypothetical protein
MGANRDRRPGLHQPLQGGERRADPEVVSHLTLFEGDVEVGPNQDPQAVDIDIVERQIALHLSPWL